MSEHGPSAPEGNVKLTVEEGGNLDERRTNAPLTDDATRALNRALIGEEDLFATAEHYGQHRLTLTLLDYNESAIELDEAETDKDTDRLPFLHALHQKRTAQLNKAINEVFVQ
jgi:hypothetical protein